MGRVLKSCLLPALLRDGTFGEEGGDSGHRVFRLPPEPRGGLSAGQFLIMDLQVQNDPRGSLRQFSISSSPTEKDSLMISTRIWSRLSQSPFKKQLHNLMPGDKVQLRAPFGKFILEQDPSKNAVMISGGVGITPLRSMIKYATDLRLDLGLTLLYSNRVPEDILFRIELAQLEKQNPRLKIVNTITHPQDSREEWRGPTRRIDEEMIRQNVADSQNSLFYVSGPPGMVKSILETLQHLDVPAAGIKSETFAGYE